MLRTYLLFLFLFVLLAAQGQNSNNNCASASPFCTGQTMNFPATTGVQNSQAGPYYGCLGSQPNPAWFFFQTQTAGSMSLVMSAANDIDFICWGPFNSLSGACSNLTQANVKSCSYSGAATETCTIANAIPGAFYLLLITNFSNTQQNITFNQSNANQPGAATTNCGFVCVVSPTNSGIICANSPVTLSITANTSSAVTSFTWLGPNSYGSNQAIQVLTGLQASGVYTLMGTVNSTINGTPYTNTCQATTNVSVVAYPQFTINPSLATICQGGSVTAAVAFTNTGPPPVAQFNWQATLPGSIIWAPQQSSTLIQPPILPATTSLATMVYSLTVTPVLKNCPTTQTMAIIINNPFTPSLGLPGPLCNNQNPIILAATPGGGTWSANPALSASGQFSPSISAIGTNTVRYSVSVGLCDVSNTGTIEVSRFHTAALSGSVSTRCVQDPVYYLKNIVQDTTTGSWSGTSVSNNFFNPSGLATGNYVLTYNSPSFPNPTVCPSSTTYVMAVFNPPTPQISTIIPRCNTSTTMQLSASPVGGVWSGNSGVSAMGVQTPSLNSNGVNSVTYTAGQGTCVASSSRTFAVSRFNTAALTGSVPPLCVSSTGFNLISIVQNTTGVWSGVSVNNGVFTPAGLPTGIYTLSYNTSSFPDAGLCPDASSIHVSVLNPPTPSIQATGPFCSQDGPVQIQVIPPLGQWLSSSYLSNTGMFSPSLAPIGSNMVAYSIGTSTCNTQQTIFVSVEAFVPATVVQQLRDLCVTTPVVNLAPFTANTSGNWVGQGITGNNFSPAMSGAGLFQLIYKTASQPSNLCPDADTLAVRVYSLAPPLVNPVGPFCTNAFPVKLKVSPLGGVFAGTNTGALNNQGLFNPALGVIGKNLISYSISSGPCIAYTQATIEIETFVSAAVIRQPDLAYCVNREPFNLNGFVQNTGGTWNGPGLVGANMFDPSTSNVGSKNILTYHTQSKNNALLCPDVSTLVLNVKNLPNASISTSSLSGCAPLQVRFSSPENTSGKGLWSLDDGAKQEGFSMAHTFTSSGTYNVVYNYEDTEAPGCAVQVKLNQPVVVYPQPQANFELPDEITMNDPKIKFINTSTPLADNYYLWTVQGMGQYFDVHPIIEFPERGTYRIHLQATDVRGCKAEVSRFAEVKNDLGYYIPNSFTPNFDGLNDVFMPVFSPYGLDQEGYSLRVFDRWGREVFSTRNISTGWDGSFMNKGGSILKEDVYTYQVQFRDLDARVNQRQGSVTLLR